MNQNQSVFITGGAGGLGLAISRVFYSRGWKVAVCGRNQAVLDAAMQEMPGLVAIRADISIEQDRDDLFKVLKSDFEAIDVFINNAAINRAHDYNDPFTLGSSRERDEIEINFAAPIELTRRFLDWRNSAHERPHKAAVVMVSTPGALMPLEANPMYCSTKAGLHMFTLILRGQLKETGVDVIEVFPPGLETGLTTEINVPSQVENGESVIAEVAEKIVEGILNRDQTILPHPDAEGLYKKFAVEYDERLMSRLNQGVLRRKGWNREAK